MREFHQRKKPRETATAKEKKKAERSESTPRGSENKGNNTAATYHGKKTSDSADTKGTKASDNSGKLDLKTMKEIQAKKSAEALARHRAFMEQRRGQ